MSRCWECNLPDPYHGNGDGIGSCDCSRCEFCGGPPGVCDCAEDDFDDGACCGDPGCACGGDEPPAMVTVDTRGLL